MHDALGDRMKKNYESRSKFSLPRRTHTIIRVDGKAFHTYTKGLKVPFDEDFIEDMNLTAIKLCEGIQGARLAYVQSDEISVLLTDFTTPTTDAWFDGNVQKMCSVGASIATEAFNRARMYTAYRKGGEIKPLGRWAHFDARVWTIPDPVEVSNYFIWRQNDSTRNSIQSVARANFSHKELHDKGIKEMQEMLHQEKDINWNDFPVGQKRGRIVLRKERDVMIKPPLDPERPEQKVRRNVWVIEEPVVFSKDQEFLASFLKSLRESKQ